MFIHITHHTADKYPTYLLEVWAASLADTSSGYLPFPAAHGVQFRLELQRRDPGPLRVAQERRFGLGL